MSKFSLNGFPTSYRFLKAVIEQEFLLTLIKYPN